MADIHPTAQIDAGAELADSVAVGAFSVIGSRVSVGPGTVIGPHVVIDSNTRIGSQNRIFQFASIGAAAQDKKYAGEPTWLQIGDRNTIREFVTLNRGTAQGRGTTTIGHDNWIMAYTHVAHDCVIGDQTILANNATLGGHVELGDWTILGGCTAIHQFCKVGAHAMTGAGTIVLHDVPPFVMVSGNTAHAHGINSEGLRRRGFSNERINSIRRAYKTLYKSGLTLEDARQALKAEVDAGGEAVADLAALFDFLRKVDRGIVR